MGPLHGPIKTALFAVLIALTLGCDAPPRPDEGAAGAAVADDTRIVELAAAFPLAVSRVETRLIDFGGPEARRHLGEGWSRDEAGKGGSSWVWAVGNRSTLTLFGADDGPRSVVLQARPASPPAGTARRVRVRVGVNGTRVADLHMKPEPVAYRFRIPRGVLRPGQNEVAFDFGEDGGSAAPAAGPPGEPRRSARFQELHLLGGPPEAEPRLQGESIEIPRGTRLETFFHLAPGAALSLAAVEPADRDASGSLLVAVDRDAGPLARARWNAGETPPPLEIPLREAHFVRVSLHALDGAVQLTNAAVSGIALGPPEPPVRSAAAPSDERPNVIIYLVDTLRADHLGAYGYTRPTSPAIDAFAGRSVTFLEARANSSWTRPSAATVLTGLLPRTHGAVGRQDALPESVTTLAERLQRHGYATAGFVTNGNTAEEFGFAQGFDFYDRLPERNRRPEVHVGSAILHRRVLKWLDERDADKPFFLYIHASDPHAPYTPPPAEVRGLAPQVRDLRVGSLAFLKQLESRSAKVLDPPRDDIVSLYDAEIAAWDGNFGDFVNALEKRGAFEDSLIVFTSDHGEEFSEHGGWQHGHTLYGEQLRVPLILHFPDGRHAGERPEVPVEHTDIVPTILEHVRLAQNPELPGARLGERMGQTALRGRPLYSSLNVDGLNIESLELDGLKLVEYGSYPAWESNPRLVELFDLHHDPEEQDDLASRRPVTTGYLRQQLRAYRRGIAAPLGSATGSVDSETEEALRAMGYVE
jgi:arylsulfatase A-like enzyme